MLKYLAAAVTAVVLAAMLTYAAFSALSRECSLGDALPKAASQSAPSPSTSPTEKSGQPAAAPRAPSKSPMASFDIKIAEQDRMQGTIFFESWQGSKAEWAHRFLCDVKAGEFVTAIFSALLIVFAGLLLGVTHQFWLATRQIARAQRSDTEIVQRAYLSAYPMGINPLDAASYAEGHVEFRNGHRYDARGFAFSVAGITSQQALQLGRAAVSTEGAIYHQYGNDAD